MKISDSALVHIATDMLRKKGKLTLEDLLEQNGRNARQAYELMVSLAKDKLIADKDDGEFMCVADSKQITAFRRKNKVWIKDYTDKDLQDIGGKLSSFSCRVLGRILGAEGGITKADLLNYSSDEALTDALKELISADVVVEDDGKYHCCLLQNDYARIETYLRAALRKHAEEQVKARKNAASDKQKEVADSKTENEDKPKGAEGTVKADTPKSAGESKKAETSKTADERKDATERNNAQEQKARDSMGDLLFYADIMGEQRVPLFSCIVKLNHSPLDVVAYLINSKKEEAAALFRTRDDFDKIRASIDSLDMVHSVCTMEVSGESQSFKMNKSFFAQFLPTPLEKLIRDPHCGIVFDMRVKTTA